MNKTSTKVEQTGNFSSYIIVALTYYFYQRLIKVGTFIHGDLKLTLLLSQILKTNKNRKCYIYINLHKSLK
jgi:hypothetical protein